MKTILAAILAYSLGAGVPTNVPLAVSKAADQASAGILTTDTTLIPNLGFGWVTSTRNCVDLKTGLPIYEIITPIRIPQTVIPVTATP